MKQRDAISLLLGLTLATIVTIGKVNAATNVEPETIPHRVECEFYVEPETTIAEIETEIETEVETESQFAGYNFIPLSNDVQCEIYALCENYQISYELTLAVIKTESEFQLDAIGDNGQAIGPCQIWPMWWQSVADEHSLNIYDPIDNIELMMIILNGHLEVCEDDMQKALQMYNTGKPNGNIYSDKVFTNYHWIMGEIENGC